MEPARERRTRESLLHARSQSRTVKTRSGRLRVDSSFRAYNRRQLTTASGCSEVAARARQPEPRAFFTERSLAARLSVSDRLIRKWVKEGRLRSYKLGGCRRFDPADVDAFLAEHREERRVA